MEKKLDFENQMDTQNAYDQKLVSVQELANGATKSAVDVAIMNNNSKI